MAAAGGADPEHLFYYLYLDRMLNGLVWVTNSSLNNHHGQRFMSSSERSSIILSFSHPKINSNLTVCSGMMGVVGTSPGFLYLPSAPAPSYVC